MIEGSVCIHIYFGTQLRAVGPLGEEQCRDWIDRQERPDEWSIVPVEPVDTLNGWEAKLREEGTIIFDFDGFADWRQEWLMTKTEFDIRVGKCTVGPASSLEPRSDWRPGSPSLEKP